MTAQELLKELRAAVAAVVLSDAALDRAEAGDAEGGVTMVPAEMVEAIELFAELNTFAMSLVLEAKS